MKALLHRTVCAAALFSAFGAYAQTAPQADDGKATGIAEIVVTAQKRSESIQKVPIAISAIGSEQLQEQNIVGHEGLVSATSGLEIHHSSTGAQPFIRSVGNNTSTAGNEPPIATYVDGVYRPSPSGSLYSFNGIERVEVLKGPQGTLFGRNAAGGVINIITKTPQSTPSIDAKLGYGNFNTVSASFYGTTGLAENLAADIALSGFKQSEGWGKNLFNGQDAFLNYNVNGRTKWRWTPSDNTTITAAVDYDKTRGNSGMGLIALPGSFANPAIRTGGYYDTFFDRRQYLLATQWGGSLHIEHSLGWADLTSISSARYLKSRGQQNTGLDAASTSYFTYSVGEDTYTQEVNLQAPASSDVKWIVGLYYFNDKSLYDPFGQMGTSFGNGPDGGRLSYVTQKSTSYAAYSQATFPLWTDDAHLTLAVRYTQDNRKIPVADRFTRTASGALTPLPFAFTPTSPRDITQDAFTYKAAFDYAFTPRIMGYASYNRGFKSGNFNLTNPAETPLRPQFIDAFEGGLKSRLFEGRAVLNLSAFYYKVHDLQVRSVGPTGAPINNNAAEARYQGLKGELTAELTSQLQLSANATYVSTEYSSFPATSFITINPNGTLGASYIGDATGREVLYTQPFSASINLRYEAPVASGTMTANVNLSYHSRSWYDAQNLLQRPEHTLLNGSLEWKTANERWGVNIWGQNLLDEQYYSILLPLAGAGLAYSPAAPRTFGVAISYHY